MEQMRTHRFAQERLSQFQQTYGTELPSQTSPLALEFEHGHEYFKVRDVLLPVRPGRVSVSSSALVNHVDDCNEKDDREATAQHEYYFEHQAPEVQFGYLEGQSHLLGARGHSL